LVDGSARNDQIPRSIGQSPAPSDSIHPRCDQELPNNNYHKRMVADHDYILLVRLRDLYVDKYDIKVGLHASATVPNHVYMYYNKGWREYGIIPTFEMHLALWINTVSVTDQTRHRDDFVVQLHAWTAYRKFEPHFWICTSPYACVKMVIRDHRGVSWGWVYVNLDKATVYSTMTIKIVDQIMTQICEKTNNDIGNHVRLMLGDPFIAGCMLNDHTL
jgi:hypothetical protein